MEIELRYIVGDAIRLGLFNSLYKLHKLHASWITLLLALTEPLIEHTLRESGMRCCISATATLAYSLANDGCYFGVKRRRTRHCLSINRPPRYTSAEAGYAAGHALYAYREIL